MTHLRAIVTEDGTSVVALTDEEYADLIAARAEAAALEQELIAQRERALAEIDAAEQAGDIPTLARLLADVLRRGGV